MHTKDSYNVLSHIRTLHSSAGSQNQVKLLQLRQKESLDSLGLAGLIIFSGFPWRTLLSH